MKTLVHKLAAPPEWLQDAALALVLAVIYVAMLVPSSGHLHPFGLAAGLVLLETLPLAGRRRWPVAVFAVIAVARVAYDLVPLPGAPFPIAPAIAYFTVIEQSRPRARQAVTVLAVAAIITSQTAPGHTEPSDLMVSALLLLTAWLAGMLSRTRQAYLREVEARAVRAEAERDVQTARAAAAERARIAQELHDVVAHHVSLMAVQAEAAASLLPGSPVRAARSVDVIAATARQALTELRRLLGVLRGPGEDPRTAPAASLADIQALLGQVRAAGLPVEFRVEGKEYRLSPGTGLTAYRIVQEALTNAVRHAHAACAQVTVRYDPGFLTVRVADSGPSPLVPPVPSLAGAGLGLAGITERVASCGGTLTVGPDGQGFTVDARLPAP